MSEKPNDPLRRAYYLVFWAIVAAVALGWLSTLSGCGLLVHEPRPFTAGQAQFSALAALATPSVPYTPGPKPEGPCESCGGQGWLGDGTIKFDCPDCDLDPLSRSAPPVKTTTSPDGSPTDGGTDAAAPLAAITWLTSLNDAQSVAADSGKPILLHTWFDGCKPCVVLEESCLSDPAVVAFVEATFVPLKVDLLAKRSDGKTGAQSLKESLGFSSAVPAPAELLLDADANAISDLTPAEFDRPKDYLNHLKELLP